MDDWGDIDGEETVLPASRAPRRSSRRSQGLEREQRFIITLAVISAFALAFGVSVGFALGRLTAPKQAPAPVAKAEPSQQPTAGVDPLGVTETTASTEPTFTAEVTQTASAADENEAPRTPEQLSPDDGDRIDASRVSLKWSKVTDPDGDEVTYAFEIQNYSNGKWGSAQVIDHIESRSYSVRVLSNRRRWRVWAVDSKGNESDKSDWSTFRKASSSSSPSTSTAGN